jgi:hypothetical protein
MQTDCGHLLPELAQVRRRYSKGRQTTLAVRRLGFNVFCSCFSCPADGRKTAAIVSEGVGMGREGIDDAFRKALNVHGYGFHYATLKAVEDASGGPHNWHVSVCEFGVEVRGRDTRVDLVIQKGRQPFYLIGECKRANPAVAHWCFARASWPRADSLARMSFAEEIKRGEDGKCYTSLESMVHTDRAYQVALEVRTGQQGDSSGVGRGVIEESLGQVCRGLNGFLAFLASRDDVLPVGGKARLLPVIFTTAKIFASPVEVGTADLRSGELHGAMGLEERDWVWLDYPQSPGIKHQIPHKPVSPLLAEVFYGEFMRRVAIVSAPAIETFLRSSMWEVI